MRSLLFCLLLFTLGWGKEPEIVYLTYTQDPTTTMTIQWHTPIGSPPELTYRTPQETTWHTATGRSGPLAQSGDLVHTITLTELSPNTLYEFQFSPESIPYRFQTLPATLTKRPLTFITSGDAYMYLSLFRKMNTTIAAKNPDFVIIGGDMAYSIGFKGIFSNFKWQLNRWQTFLKEWTRQAVTSDNRLIPFLPILGNHDLNKSYKYPLGDPPYFFQLFAFPEEDEAYRALSFGNYLGLTLLDTGHKSPIAGEQTEWLRKTLKTQVALPYKIAAYHQAAYPSVYKAEKKGPTLIRQHWVPHFEHNHVQVAFEHHNHAFKRTFRIKNNRIDPTGILYLGDGAWGIHPRSPHKLSKVWYLEKAEKVNHFWLTTLSEEGMLLQAFDIKGNLIDQVVY